jgi:hypothetical protein
MKRIIELVPMNDAQDREARRARTDARFYSVACAVYKHPSERYPYAFDGIYATAYALIPFELLRFAGPTVLLARIVDHFNDEIGGAAGFMYRQRPGSQWEFSNNRVIAESFLKNTYWRTRDRKMIPVNVPDDYEDKEYFDLYPRRLVSNPNEWVRSWN